MRLLQVMLAPGDGGAETFFEKLAVAFQEAGIEQRLVICRHPERAARLRAAGCEVVEIAARGWRKWLAKRNVRAEVEEYRPAVAMAWMSRAAGSLPAVPGVVNVARLGGYYPLKYYRNCARLVANTPGVVRYLVEAGWPEDRIEMVTNFGEVPDRSEARSLRAELSIPGEARVLLSMGRLHENKAHDVALKVLAEIPDGILLLAGTGEWEQGLRALAAEIGVEERVRFLGWRRDVENLYETADLSLFPSRVEPLGNVVLETWAFEVPIVAAASEGPSWLIEDGANGLLFPVDEVSAGAAAVRLLLDDEQLRERLVAGGRATLAAKFSREVIVGAYRALFERLEKGGEE